MIVKAKKYGNSHVINIPNALWDFFRFNKDSRFSFENENGQLVIRAKSDIESNIEEIENQYGEVFQRLANK